MQNLTILALALVICSINAAPILDSNSLNTQELVDIVTDDYIAPEKENSATTTNDQDNTTFGALGILEAGVQTTENITTGKCLFNNTGNILVLQNFGRQLLNVAINYLVCHYHLMH